MLEEITATEIRQGHDCLDWEEEMYITTVKNSHDPKEDIKHAPVLAVQEGTSIYSLYSE